MYTVECEHEAKMNTSLTGSLFVRWLAAKSVAVCTANDRFLCHSGLV